MPAAKYDLYIEQGADYSKSIILKNPDGSIKDLSNMAARLQIRQYVFSSTVLVEILSTGITPGILINTTTGTITLKITNAQTGLLDTKAAVYDLELVDQNGNVTRLLEGSVSISPEVTR